MKIRLMSARRHLWGKEVSLIHLETAGLQIRKSCECIANLCIIIADIEFETIPAIHHEYSVGKILNHLAKIGKLKLPNQYRMERIGDENASSAHWQLSEAKTTALDETRVKSIYDRLGEFMHERSAYKDWPNSNDATQFLMEFSNVLKSEHQWIWNRFWQHSTSINGNFFSMNFGEFISASAPQLMLDESLKKDELFIDFDPHLVADFVGIINWKDYE